MLIEKYLRLRKLHLRNHLKPRSADSECVCRNCHELYPLERQPCLIYESPLLTETNESVFP